MHLITCYIHIEAINIIWLEFYTVQCKACICKQLYLMFSLGILFSNVQFIAIFVLSDWN